MDKFDFDVAADTAGFRLSKRELITGAGAAAALALMPRISRAASETWDLIVVGGGSAGLPCAIFAAQQGARVLVVDRAHRLGGTLDRSFGQIAAAGTRFQAEQEIEDSPEAHFDDIMRISKGKIDQDLVRVFVNEAARTIDWLGANGFTPLPGHPVVGGGHEPYLTRRYQWAEQFGVAILKVMLPQFLELARQGSIEFLIRTDALELIQDDSGAVNGVMVRDATGRKMDLLGRKVALTTGGCAGNPEMFRELHGVPLYARMAYPYNLGGGLEMGVGAGGTLRGAELFQVAFGMVLKDFNVPSTPAPVQVRTTPQSRLPWEVYVNSGGQRFVREDHPSVDAREHALLGQKDHRFWIVFDQQIMDSAPSLVGGWDRERMDLAFDKYHFFSRGDSLAELAYWAGIDGDGLTASIGRYNSGQAGGQDPDFGREHMPLPVGKPPYYAIRMQGTHLISFAGLTVNPELQVLNGNGDPIPNLYAAGEVLGAGATTGFGIVNGMLLTPALVFGRMIGERVFA
ncbi:MAG: FAD-dependent oxidoreductase [Gammaproteobacteria bacterium]|nr:FAD-dependent oxidoreductase [Gammaproteobacteria bacterium]